MLLFSYGFVDGISGRARATVQLVGSLGFLLSWAYWCYGPRGRYIHVDDLPDAFLPDPDAARPVVPVAAQPGAPSEVALLKAEIERLRAAPAVATQHPPLGAPAFPSAHLAPEAPEPQATPAAFDAFRAFATGAPPSGPLSQTALRMDGAVPCDPPPLPPPAYAPGQAYAAATPPTTVPTAASPLYRQAAKVASAWESTCGTWMTNPRWLADFWKVVADLQAAEGLSPPLVALLQAHGYSGADSVVAPSSSFGADLQRLAANGLGPTVAAVDLQPTSPQGVVGRFPNQLPTTLRRAAPEILEGLLCQGATTCQEWLIFNYPDAKADHRWTDLWNSAVTIDMELGRAASQAERDAMLANGDLLEVHLRRLSAYVYERRTGDKKGAVRILARAPPGSNADIGPRWLIDEASQYTKLEHQRNTWVNGWQPRGRGGGRGAQSSGDSGGGGGDSGGAPAARGRGATRGKPRGRGGN